MEKKTGNFTIISGETLAFVADEITLNSFGDINNVAAEKIFKVGESDGHIFNNYKNLVFKKINVKIEDTVSFNFYHTWVPTQHDTEHIGNDIIVVNEKRIIKVIENGKELKQSTQRFVTDYFAHVDDNSVFDGFAYSTFYYHDSTNTKQLLNKEHYRPMLHIVKKYAQDVANYKKKHRDGSPVQAKAVENRKENEKNGKIFDTTGAIGDIISKIPNPYTEYGGEAISVISGGLKSILQKAEHGDTAVIMFTLEYKNII